MTTATKILIVDDEPAGITLLKGLLPREHQFVAATDGLTALALARRHQPAEHAAGRLDRRHPG